MIFFNLFFKWLIMRVCVCRRGGRPPNPRRGTNRKGRWCAGGDGVGAVGAVERNSEGMGGVRVFSGDVSDRS